VTSLWSSLGASLAREFNWGLTGELTREITGDNAERTNIAPNAKRTPMFFLSVLCSLCLSVPFNLGRSRTRTGMYQVPYQVYTVHSRVSLLLVQRELPFLRQFSTRSRLSDPAEEKACRSREGRYI
jgi:hypothetical protein